MNLIHDMQYYHDDGLKFAAIELPYEVNSNIFDLHSTF